MTSELENYRLAALTTRPRGLPVCDLLNNVSHSKICSSIYLTGFPGLFCFYNNRNYMAGQSFPSNDGCNTCTCNGHNRVTCTERACFPNPSEG